MQDHNFLQEALSLSWKKKKNVFVSLDKCEQQCEIWGASFNSEHI